MLLRLEEINEGIWGELVSEVDYIFTAASIDSRETKEGDLFFALKGHETDGHLYISEAVNKGAKGIVIADSELANIWKGRVGVILVDDTLKALHKLANYVRTKYSATIICITGSMGKTTTKDYAAKIISCLKKVMKSEGNLNSITGLPVSLIRLMPEDEVAVLEMATNKKGEISRLTEISQPDIGVILNIAEAHIEYFGTIKGVAEEKVSLARKLRSDSTLIFNNDDGYLRDIDVNRKFSYGIKVQSDLMIKDAEERDDGYSGYFYEGGEEYYFDFPVRGRWNLYNLLAAVSIARKLGISWRMILKEVSNLTVSERRGEVSILSNGIKLIDESYNSNPSSLMEIMNEFNGMRWSGRKIAIVGDMLELGEHSMKFHLQVLREIRLMTIDFVIGVGPLMKEAIDYTGKQGDGVSFLSFGTSEECGEFLKDFLQPLDAILVKGSRRIQLDRIVELLKLTYGVMN